MAENLGKGIPMTLVTYLAGTVCIQDPGIDPGMGLFQLMRQLQQQTLIAVGGHQLCANGQPSGPISLLLGESGRQRNGRLTTQIEGQREYTVGRREYEGPQRLLGCGIEGANPRRRRCLGGGEQEIEAPLPPGCQS